MERLLFTMLEGNCWKSAMLYTRISSENQPYIMAWEIRVLTQYWGGGPLASISTGLGTIATRLGSPSCSVTTLLVPRALTMTSLIKNEHSNQCSICSQNLSWIRPYVPNLPPVLLTIVKKRVSAKMMVRIKVMIMITVEVMRKAGMTEQPQNNVSWSTTTMPWKHAPGEIFHPNQIQEIDQ